MKKKVLTCLFLFAIGAGQPALSQPPSTTYPAEMNQQEMNRFAHEEFEKSDAELNRLWNRLQPLLTPDVKEKLVDSQRLWIKWRDAEATAQSQAYAGGTLAPFLYSSSLKDTTDQRIKQLQEWIQANSH